VSNDRDAASSAGPANVVRAWCAAYTEGRGEDMLAVAHEDILVQPRRGQGEREYRGLDGLREYIAVIGVPPPPFRLDRVEELADGRLLAVGQIHGTSVCAVFTIEDAKVRSVASYVTDPDLLHEIGRI
jgi:SnoaL-like protein